MYLLKQGEDLLHANCLRPYPWGAGRARPQGDSRRPGVPLPLERHKTKKEEGEKDLPGRGPPETQLRAGSWGKEEKRGKSSTWQKGEKKGKDIAHQYI